MVKFEFQSRNKLWKIVFYAIKEFSIKYLVVGVQIPS